MLRGFNSLNGAINIFDNDMRFLEMNEFQFLKWCD